MPVVQSFNFTRPGSGTKDGLQSHLLGPDDFSFLASVKPMSGVYAKIGGTVQQGDAPDAAPVRWLWHGYGNNASTAVINRLRTCNGKIQYLTGGAWTSLATGLSTSLYPTSFAYKGDVFWMNGTDTPRRITIGSTPTIASWTTMPTGINPRWGILHKNRVYIGADLSDPQQVWMCDPGTPHTFQTTEFYQVPDDQNGNYPKMAVAFNDGIGLFCQDFLVALTGTGASSHRFYSMPRGAACVAWRTVVDMGEFGAFFLSEHGVYAWDLHSPPVPLDPYEHVNTRDIDYTTEENAWACRYGDYYLLGFKSKGDLATSSAGASAILLSSTGYTRLGSYISPRNRVTRTAFSSSGNCDHYYLYDARRKIWTGPHTGSFLCGAWEQYRYGDTQDLWLGDATTGGTVVKFDQQSSATDNGVDRPVVIRTGAFGNPFRKIRILRVRFIWSAALSAGASIRVAIFQDGRESEPPVAQASFSLQRIGEEGFHEEFRVHEWEVSYDTVSPGRRPFVEFQCAGREPMWFGGYEVEYEVEK
jgi:hypothetical protein